MIPPTEPGITFLKRMSVLQPIKKRFFFKKNGEPEDNQRKAENARGKKKSQSSKPGTVNIVLKEGKRK